MSLNYQVSSLLSDAQRMQQTSMPEIRKNIAEKVTHFYNAGVFEEKELEIAHEIIRLLVHDTEVRVRKTLSENLKVNRDIPRDIVLKLSNDVLEVALPVLEFSAVLTNQDLIAIIQSTKETARLKAIARRQGVAEPVSHELIQTRQEEVVSTLINNKTASVSIDTMEDVLTHFKQNGRVMESMVHRGGLPIGVAEKLVALVSGALKQKLINDYQIAERKIQDIVDSAREQATLGLLQQGKTDPLGVASSAQAKQAARAASLQPQTMGAPEAVPQVRNINEELVKHLHENNRLTHSIVLRAICEGNIGFFEAGMAKLAGIPSSNAHVLIHDVNPLAFRSLFEKAHMPRSTFNAVHIVLQQALKEAEDGILEDGGFKHRLIEYVMESGFDRSVPLMKYLMVLIASDLHTSDIVN